MRSYPWKLILPIMNHKVYEARCSSNVNQQKFSDLNVVVLACAGWGFFSFLISFLICCFLILDELVMNAFGLVTPLQISVLVCHFLVCWVLFYYQKCYVTHILVPKRKSITDWTVLSRSLFWPFVQICSKLLVMCYKQFVTICRAPFTALLWSVEHPAGVWTRKTYWELLCRQSSSILV